MQDTYNEVLKEEIYRVLELEAENAVLQQALRSLPQLQRDRAALLSMRERRKKENQCECGRKNISEGSVEEDGEDTEEDIAIVHADVGNEEYLEALEVLNHHELTTSGSSLSLRRCGARLSEFCFCFGFFLFTAIVDLLNKVTNTYNRYEKGLNQLIRDDSNREIVVETLLPFFFFNALSLRFV